MTNIGGGRRGETFWRLIRFGIVTAVILGTLSVSPAAPIKPDEEVVFFPTFGYTEQGGETWKVLVHGWVYEPEEESIIRESARKLFNNLLDLKEGEEPALIFHERARWFLVDNERGKAISIRLAQKEYPLNDSTPDGHFSGSLALSRAEVERLTGRSSSRSGWIEFETVPSRKNVRQFKGSVQLIQRKGLSVISDIDDTIKISEVNDRNALLSNTFLKEFRVVAGMEEVYRSWADEGAVFHYVSAGPWQLYEPLSRFFRELGFPDGSYHMRIFRIKDPGFVDLFSSSESYKLQTIRSIIEAFGKRTFFLVGDSGERDPEVYGALAREYRQIAKIFIREVAGESPDPYRYREAFRDVERSRWMIFKDAEDLPETLQGKD